MLGLAPHPGVSYLFQNPTPTSATDDALLNVALGIGGVGAGGMGNGMGNGVLHSPPPSWTPALGELVLKVDGKFKVSYFFSYGNGDGKMMGFGAENYFGALEGSRRLCAE